MKKYLRLARVHHYIKNGLVFFPILFGGRLFDRVIIWEGMKAFFAFCLTSSLIYIINDLKDVEKDRQHPKKRNRPLASGAVSKKSAKVLLFCFVSLLLVLCWMIDSYYATLCLIVYIVLNILYSYKLKQIPIVDITILVSGFFLRVLYGSVVTEIPISPWLFLTIIALSFYLGLGKRRNELKDIKDGETREVLKQYTFQFLDKNMYMCLALTNVFYSLWAANYVRSGMIWTVPLVIIISMKYSLVIEGDSDGDPTEIILHDKTIMILGVLYLLLIGYIIYGNSILSL